MVDSVPSRNVTKSTQKAPHRFSLGWCILVNGNLVTWQGAFILQLESASDDQCCCMPDGLNPLMLKPCHIH